MFIDLINRLESKHEVIKGVQRKPKAISQSRINFEKVLDFLKQNEKMNSRYLYAEEYLLNGDHDVFWGLLDDIWYLYHNKNSPNDPRYTLPIQVNQRKSRQNSGQNRSYNDI